MHFHGNLLKKYTHYKKACIFQYNINKNGIFGVRSVHVSVATAVCFPESPGWECGILFRANPMTHMTAETLFPYIFIFKKHDIQNICEYLPCKFS